MIIINFKIPAKDRKRVDAIVADAVNRKIVPKKLTQEITMSLCACIAQGCKLDLDKLAGFNDFNLAHDLYGINMYIDKNPASDTAGKLTNFFLPRCSVPSTT